jgi:hypothetical protein
VFLAHEVILQLCGHPAYVAFSHNSQLISGFPPLEHHRTLVATIVEAIVAFLDRDPHGRAGSHSPAAIHDQHLSRDRRGSLGGQEHDRAADVVRLTVPAQGRLAHDSLIRLTVLEQRR